MKESLFEARFGGIDHLHVDPLRPQKVHQRPSGIAIRRNHQTLYFTWCRSDFVSRRPVRVEAFAAQILAKSTVTELGISFNVGSRGFHSMFPSVAVDHRKKGKGGLM